MSYEQLKPRLALLKQASEDPLASTFKDLEVTTLQTREGEKNIHIKVTFGQCTVVRNALLETSGQGAPQPSPISSWTSFFAPSRPLPTPRSPAVTEGPLLGLDDLFGANLCPGCLRNYLNSPRVLDTSDLSPRASNANLSLGHVLYLLTLRRRATNIAKIPKDVTSGTLTRRQTDITAIASKCARAIVTQASDNTPQSIIDEYSELEIKAGKILAKVKEHLGGDGVRAKVESKIRDMLLPSEFDGILLDETPRLIAFTSFTSYDHQFLSDVVNNFRINDGPNPVLLVPAFFEPIVLNLLRFKPLSRRLVLSTPAPDEEIAQAAASLWDPNSKGPLASITQAVLTAEALFD